MARKSQPETRPATIDAASNAPVLTYTGGPIYGDAPARDLNGPDLVRLARLAALRASGGTPVDPASADDLEALAEQLVASGAFSRAAVDTVGEPGPELVVADGPGVVLDAAQSRDLATNEGPRAPADPAEES